MADRPLVLCYPLCYLFSRVNKSDVKAVKSALLDFYKSEEITAAKELLLEHACKLSNDTSISRMPRRRESEGRSLREVDDIFNIIEVLDHAQVLCNLPRYVADGPEKMSSAQLLEGDLRAIMNRFDRMDGKIGHLENCINTVSMGNGRYAGESYTALAGSQQAVTASRAVNNEFMNEHRPTTSRPTAAASLQTTTANLDSVEQQQQLRYSDWPIPDWAIMSTNNRFALLSAESGSSSCDDLQGTWEETAAAQRGKRRRMHSRLQGVSAIDPSGSTGADYSLPPPRQPPREMKSVEQQSATAAAAADKATSQNDAMKTAEPVSNARNYAAAVGQQSIAGVGLQRHVPRQRKVIPMLIGRKTDSSSQATAAGIAAAKPYISKKFFCIDNVAINSTVEDITQFVKKLGVTVLSCYSADPRRTRWQVKHGIMPTDRKTYRLCVPREECQRLINADEWPAHIAITPWQFWKSKKKRDDAGDNAMAGGATDGQPPAAESTPDTVNKTAAAAVQTAKVARPGELEATTEAANSSGDMDTNLDDTFTNPNGGD